MKTMILVALTCAIGMVFSSACSSRSDWKDPLVEELASYEEIELTTFSIAGNIACSRCAEKDVSVSGVKIEVIPVDDPSRELGIYMFDGLGPFTISNLRYKTGAQLNLYCRLYTESDSAGYSTDVGAVVPDEDGEIVAVSVNF